VIPLLPFSNFNCLLFDESDGQRIAIVLAIVGLDPGDQQENQVENVHRRQQEKADACKTKKTRHKGIYENRNLKVHGFLALVIHEFELVLLYLPDDQRRDDTANGRHDQATKSGQSRPVPEFRSFPP
ncbi:MAG: hypothetical protein ACYTAO_16425, partial [Planctomycetota bacterium]